MALNIFTNGTVADADEVNENFAYLKPKLQIRDLSEDSSNSTTWTTIKTTTIPANKFNDYFRIIFHFDVRGSGGSANRGYSQVKLVVNDVDIITETSDPADDSDVGNKINSGTNNILYSSSDIDFSQEIVIKIQARYVLVHGDTNMHSGTCKYFEVSGV